MRIIETKTYGCNTYYWIGTRNAVVYTYSIYKNATLLNYLAEPNEPLTFASIRLPYRVPLDINDVDGSVDRIRKLAVLI